MKPLDAASTATAEPNGSSGAPASDRRRDSEATKERLLDAAERLFAEHGFEGASMRALTQAAGTSVSAANYHFGSKEALLRAAMLRRVEPINRRRLERLDALEAEAGGQPLELETLLDAFLRPLFEERAASGQSPVRFVAARLYADPPEIVSPMKVRLFGETSRRMLDALERALTGKTRAELALDFQFVVGAMVHVISGHLGDAPHLSDTPEAAEGFLSDESVLRHMIAFVAAGLRAPASEVKR